MPRRMSNCYTLTCRNLTFFTVLAVTIQIIGLSLFIVGFFPVKPSFSGMSGLESFYPPGFDSTDDGTRKNSTLPPEKLKSLYEELSGVPPLYDRLIIMVIDGLPAEFVIGKDGKPPSMAFAEAMPYTQSLLAEGLAIGYHAKAAPPTVTMPRLKAMVSGAIGGFLDIAFNFNTQAFLDDNLIAQFRRIGWKMVMLGDETWIKLFPDMFDRHDGVSSFFVKDTIQVDYNVSRHLTYELDIGDWDLLILHYLGVDHVGHIGGRNSILMAPKLVEMDEVIKKIHSSITPTENNNQKQTLLMIVSDHGMTDSGNHGGSSFEETDSLAIFVSGQKFKIPEKSQEAYQVDIASTLALLFGVPIPQNNVGTVMTGVFTSLEADDQQLRILELNSWQLLRLLQTHFTDLRCERYSCNSGSSKNSDAERLCCSYLAAISLHKSWLSKSSQRSVNGDDYRSIVLAYRNFLSTASMWLSSRSTDKPIHLLALGITAMGLSCLGVMSLLFLYGQEFNFMKNQRLSGSNDDMHKWRLDECFTAGIIFILILSMGSSSMIEEEQYIWYFMTTSLYLIFLRRTIQSITEHHASNLTPERKITSPCNIYYIIAVLIIGRILRGWHQGGVNWSYLPDISKLLEQAGTVHIKSMHLLSLVLVVICFAVILKLRVKTRSAALIMLIYLFPSAMILKHILKCQEAFITLSTETTAMIQVIYALIGISTVGMLVAVPWLMPITLSRDVLQESQQEVPEAGFRNSLFVIGWCNMFSWCLLQMLLQQPINSIPICLLLVQILISIRYFCEGGLHLKQWVKVAALYYLGMAGHFALGNTNTLATIDVAGAFIGISSHSTFISGILMFVITYASPMLALLSMLMCVSTVDKRASEQQPDNVDFGHLLKSTLGYPCLIPLGLNSILLLAYTIVLLLMRNHLFVWSVFSPKYMYVCATTACVYIGVSVVQFMLSKIYMVLEPARKKFQESQRGHVPVFMQRISRIHQDSSTEI
ncbi:Alkaline-phosphatase-like family protein [Striga hermonthica]|uniref:Alkaline-phosphatase-like family protein n=1 Tax=Striga hermonthica TaxID=68872 RepID=A0A9N7N2W6_STRHE|nr:Alkaline-phosphatase-like family protein [Striga hermonthica]